MSQFCNNKKSRERIHIPGLIIALLVTTVAKFVKNSSSDIWQHNKETRVMSKLVLPRCNPRCFIPFCPNRITTKGFLGMIFLFQYQIKTPLISQNTGKRKKSPLSSVLPERFFWREGCRNSI